MILENQEFLYALTLHDCTGIGKPEDICLFTLTQVGNLMKSL